MHNRLANSSLFIRWAACITIVSFFFISMSFGSSLHAYATVIPLGDVGPTSVNYSQGDVTTARDGKIPTIIGDRSGDPVVFDFGFNSKFMVNRKTTRKRLTAKLHEIMEELRDRRDGSFLAPPAQIPAGSITGYGAVIKISHSHK